MIADVNINKESVSMDYAVVLESTSATETLGAEVRNQTFTEMAGLCP